MMRMGSPETYTMRELVDRSGFDKRTIAYYVQERLLPRVGRRGPRTRYSQDFLDRLMFIRRIRDLQDSGRLRAVMLSEIRDVIQSLSTEEVGRASKQGVSEETLCGYFSEPDLDTSGVAVAAEHVALHGMRIAPDFESALVEDSYSQPFAKPGVRMRRRSRSSRVPFAGLPAAEQAAYTQHPSNDRSDDELGRLLREVERRALIGGKGRDSLARERVTRVPVSEEIVLSVRNIDDKDAHWVEKLAALLRRIGRLD
jgi:DNA-binding transcriptional MerR regulator